MEIHRKINGTLQTHTQAQAQTQTVGRNDTV